VIGFDRLDLILKKIDENRSSAGDSCHASAGFGYSLRRLESL
jgi:hypothetical protein